MLRQNVIFESTWLTAAQTKSGVFGSSMEKVIVGMVMQLNLANYSVREYRDVYYQGVQAGKDRKLSHSQLLTLQKIIGDLPKSDKEVDYGWSVFVAVRRNGKVEVFQYDRRRAPPIVQRIYDLGGGYFWDGKDH